MMPMTRPAVGQARSGWTWDSAGLGSTRAGACPPVGAGSPSPAATCAHSSVSTLASTPSVRSWTTRWVHLLSSKVYAATTCSRSGGVRLSQNSVAWLKWSSNEAGAWRTLAAFGAIGTGNST